MDIRAVVDTNVVLSGFLSHKGNPSKVIDVWARKAFVPIISPPLKKEYLAVLTYDRIQRYLGNNLKETFKTLRSLLKIAEIVYPKVTISLFKDPYDDMLIEAAISGEADFIVSGDKGVLEIEQYKTIKILTALEFIEKF